MPVEILSASQRREWERFPEEIDEAALSAFFSFADDELERIAGHRSVHGRFAIAAAVGALRWLGFVPAALEELPEPAAALVASQLDIDLISIDPDRLNVERAARAQQLAQVLTISGFRACRDADLDELGSWVADRALGHDGPLALLRSAVGELRRRHLMRPGLTVLERLVAAARSEAEREIHRRTSPVLTPEVPGGTRWPAGRCGVGVGRPGQAAWPGNSNGQGDRGVDREARAVASARCRWLGSGDDPGEPAAVACPVRSSCDEPGDQSARPGVSPSGAALVLC